jgi:hypothetical protein
MSIQLRRATNTISVIPFPIRRNQGYRNTRFCSIRKGTIILSLKMTIFSRDIPAVQILTPNGIFLIFEEDFIGRTEII